MGLATGWLDMTSIDRPVTRSVYAVVLRKDLLSPIAPESDDEKAEEKKDDKSGQAANQSKDKDKDKDKEKKEPVKVTIDFENISQRILALPIPERNYEGLAAGKEGILYVLEGPQVDPEDAPPKLIVQRFDLKTRKTEKLLEGVQTFAVSENGEKMLYRQDEKWFIAAADKPPKPGEGQIKTADMEVYVDPRAEWKQMYHEIWRIERDFFYDPHFHGLDLRRRRKRTRPSWTLSQAAPISPTCLTRCWGISAFCTCTSAAAPQPELKAVKVGLLGADYTLENGRYCLARIYNGENWNPQLHAPLTQPGVNVKEGEYLLAVNGRDLHATDDVYSFFQETAGKQVVLKVGPSRTVAEPAM